MASKIKADQFETLDGSGNITLNNSVTMASTKTLPAASLTGALPAISAASLTNIPAANITGTLPAISGANLTGITSVGGATGVDFNDNVNSRWGTGNDLRIYHDAFHSYVNNQGTGDLLIRGDDVKIQDAASGHNMGVFVEDGGVELYHNNVKKFETSATGVTVTGTAAATTFSGSGASLTSLPAANLTGTAAAINGSAITSLTAGNLTGTLPAISGANLTSLPIPSLTLNIQVLLSGNYTPSTGLTWATVYACSGGQSGESVSVFGGTNPYGYRVGGGGGYAGNMTTYTYTAAEIGTGTSTVTYGAGGATSTAPAASTAGPTASTALRNPGGSTLFDPEGTGTTLAALFPASVSSDAMSKDSDYTAAGQVPTGGYVSRLGYNAPPNGSQGADWNAAQASATGARPWQSNRLSGAGGALASIGAGSTTTSANGGAASMPGAGGGGGVARVLPYFSATGQGGAGGDGFVIVYEYLLT